MNDLQVINYKNERVLLTGQLAESYGTTNQIITNNFNRNKERYEEGKHFISLEGEKKKVFINQNQIDLGSLKNAKIIYLWTERGAFLHAKSLNTDKAWEVYDCLVEHYFKVKDTGYQIPSTPMEALGLMFEVQKQTDKRLEHLENNMTIDTTQQYHLEKMAKNKVIKLLGGKNSSAYLKYSKKVFAQLWRDYKDYFKIPSYRDTLKAKYHEAEEYLITWYPSNNLKMEIEEANRFDY